MAWVLIIIVFANGRPTIDHVPFAKESLCTSAAGTMKINAQQKPSWMKNQGEVDPGPYTVITACVKASDE